MGMFGYEEAEQDQQQQTYDGFGDPLNGAPIDQIEHQAYEEIRDGVLEEANNLVQEIQEADDPGVLMDKVQDPIVEAIGGVYAVLHVLEVMVEHKGGPEEAETLENMREGLIQAMSTVLEFAWANRTSRLIAEHIDVDPEDADIQVGTIGQEESPW